MVSPAIAVQSRVRSCAFSVWKTTVFVRFPHRQFSPKGLWKTAAWKIPDWRKVYCRPGPLCEMQKKNFDFLFYERQNVHIFAQNLPETNRRDYGLYSLFHFYCGKPGGKSGKPHGKLPAFFTKAVENPVEKVKSSFRNGNSIHFTVVEKRPKSRLTAVFSGVWAKISHSLNGPDNHGTITAKNCGKNPTILEASL